MARVILLPLVLGMVVAISGTAVSGPVISGDRNLTDEELFREILQVPQDGIGSQPVIERLKRAVQQFRRQDYDAALAAFESAREIDSNLPPGQLMLARLLLAFGQSREGRSALEQAAIDDPDAPVVYLAFGDLALHDGRLTDAQVHFRQAAQLLENQKDSEESAAAANIRVLAGLAAVAERRQDWPTAKHALSQWLDREPENAQARQRLGWILFHLDQRQEALETLRAAVEADEALEPAAVSMARLHHQAGNTAKADEWMEYALQEHSDDPRVVRAAAIRLLELGRTEEAKQQVARLRHLDPDTSSDRRLEGIIARHHGDFGSAERIFEELYRDAPADFAAANQLALVLIEQDSESKQNRALQLAEINARQYPRSAESLATLGWVYYRLGRIEQAQRVLQSAISSGRASSETAYYLARLVADMGQTEQARQLLEGAVAANGPFAYRADAQDRLKKLTSAPSRDGTTSSSAASD